MPAELFKVTCVTCKASLSVRNPALIDQIVACPKCDSMVHVLPPADPEPAPVVASAAAVVPPSAFEEPFESPPTVSTPLPETVEEPTAPSVLEVGSASNTTFLMWAAGSFVIGVTLMGTYLMLRNSNQPTPAPTQATLSTTGPRVASEPSTADGAETEGESPAPSPSPGDVAGQPSEALEPSAESSAVEPREEESSLLGPIAVPEDDVVVQPTATAIDEKPITPPQENPKEKLVIASADEPRISPKFDPLSVDPEEFSLAEMTEAGKENEAAADADEPEIDEPAAEDRPMNAVVPVRLDEESGHDSANRIASIQLKQEFPAIAVKDMPLLDFLTFVSQLGGVPVSVDAEQLQMAGITPGRPVTVDMAGAVLGDVLKNVLDPLHLEATTDGPQIIIVRQDSAKLRTVDYPVDDLYGGRLTAADFGKWIETLIAPESWQSAGGNGTIAVSGGSLKIEQTQAIQYQVLFYLERIRLAKGLPLRSKYPARLLSGKPYGVGIADRMNAPATFTFSHSTPLAEVLQYWQGEAGLPIFVDWPALASVGLWPDSRITCTSANEPWHTALDKILGPLDLAWRAAPGGAIQITSRGRAETEPVVDIYQAGDWGGNAADAVVIDDPVNGLTYVRAPVMGLGL